MLLLYYSQCIRVKMVNGGVRLEEDGVMDDEGKFGNECLPLSVVRW